MRNWSISGKPYLIANQGEVKTEVRLQADDGAYLPQIILGDHTQKSKKDLIKLALKAFGQEDLAEYFVAEAVKDVEAVKVKLKTLDEMIERGETKLKEMDTAIKESQSTTEMTQASLLEFTTKLIEAGVIKDESLLATTELS